MKYIEINRVTDKGLKPTPGELIECRGYEFCFCEGEGNYYLIELSTGFSVGSHNINEWHSQGFTAEDACEVLRDRVALATESFNKAVEKAKMDLIESGYEYPINKSINK